MTGVSHAQLHPTRTPRKAHAARRNSPQTLSPGESLGSHDSRGPGGESAPHGTGGRPRTPDMPNGTWTSWTPPTRESGIVDLRAARTNRALTRLGHSEVCRAPLALGRREAA